MRPTDARSTRVDGIRTRWFESGEGVPVILLHGIPTSPLLWRKVVPALRNVKVYAWEMIGYGESIPAGEGEDISMSRQARHLLRWMDEVGIEQAIFAGHDLGGGVAQMAAARHRSRCLGLFLTNSIGYDSWPIPSVRLLRSMDQIVERLPGRVLDQVVMNLLSRGHDDRGRAKEAFRIHTEPYKRYGFGAALAQQVRHLRTEDTLAVQGELPKLQVPARVVWGEADRFQKIDYGERLARDLGAPLDRIKDGRHFTPEDHPARIARGLNELVMQVRQETGTKMYQSTRP